MNEFEDVPTLSLLRTIENISAELKRRRVVAPEKRDAQQAQPAIKRSVYASQVQRFGRVR